MKHRFAVTARAATTHAPMAAQAVARPVAACGRTNIVDWTQRALSAAATSWFVFAVLGQLMFVVYIVGFYGRAAAQGRFEAWNKVLPHGYVAGDSAGNLVLSMHLVFAAFITIGGALQLATGVRRLFPTFHRWNGRVYLMLALVMSLGGLIMVWTRGTVGDLSQHIAISINAVLIMVCGGMTVRHALARRFLVHRRWALRLFLVVSGVWFFRIGLMLWIVVNQGPVGFDPKTFSGPFLTFLAFAQYLLPLAILELYFRAQASTAPRLRVLMAAGLFSCVLMTAAGAAAATMIMWLPRL
ncbi:MAG: DUF2306 domain-containing protein [Dokdonella sp.]